jgi:predicted DNA-binding ribbon-helix-helix protein
MKSPVVKRSVVLAGHKTSVSLEDAFWRGLKDIAWSRRMTLSDLIGSIDLDREYGNLSSALRLFVLNDYQVRPVSKGANGSQADADATSLIEPAQSAIVS